MGKRITYICDQCGTDTSELAKQKPSGFIGMWKDIGWLELNITPHISWAFGYTAGGDKLTFCSADCLYKFLERHYMDVDEGVIVLRKKSGEQCSVA